MTSYGGATSALSSPARARWYRIPGRARMSAIVPPAQLDVPEVRHPGHLTQPGQHLFRDALVDGQDHHRVAPRRVAADLHARDVHVVLAQDRAKPPNHPRAVLMPADQEATLGHKVD